MLSVEQLNYLSSPQGRSLLCEASRNAPGDGLLWQLEHFRKGRPAADAAAVISLTELRRRAESKFTRASEMFFTREGLEQSTGEAIAKWRAAFYPKNAVILDLCCGVGGDAAQLAGRGRVFAFDRSPAQAKCCQLNGRVYEVDSQLDVAIADVTAVRLKGDAAFFDPSRRRAGRRVRRGELYDPPLEFVNEIRRAIPDLAVKVSPALDDATVESLGGQVEFVSEGGQCKEAVVWFGSIRTHKGRTATVLPAAESIVKGLDAPPVRITEPQGWLIEPDPAVIRAHLVAELAEKLGASKIDEQIAYLTANEFSPSPFATGYSIIESLPFNLRRIQSRLRALKAHPATIKKRGVPMTVEDIGQRLKPGGDRPIVLVMTRTRNELAAILCNPPG